MLNQSDSQDTIHCRLNRQSVKMMPAPGPVQVSGLRNDHITNESQLSHVNCQITTITSNYFDYSLWEWGIGFLSTTSLHMLNPGVFGSYNNLTRAGVMSANLDLSTSQPSTAERSRLVSYLSHVAYHLIQYLDTLVLTDLTKIMWKQQQGEQCNCELVTKRAQRNSWRVVRKK